MRGRCGEVAKEFYSPREIHFSRQTARWVIQNLGSLRTGDWPPEVSSYVDIPIGKRTVGRKAPFITPVECAAEITARMERCGIDGLILLAMECWGESPAALAKYLGMPEWAVKKGYTKALYYVASGPDRRWHDIYDKQGELKRKGESYQQFRIRRKKKRINSRRE